MILFDLPPWLAYPYLFVLGCVVGSFLNVCIHRIPQHHELTASLKGIWSPPSSCPRCRRRIRWQDNIPIIGWLRLRGRCRDCRMRISVRYPAIELLNGLLWMALYWLEVPTELGARIQDSGIYSPIGPQGNYGAAFFTPEAVVNLRFAYHLVLVEALLVATFIDWDLWIIPDGVTLPATAVGLTGALLSGCVHLVPVWFQSPTLLRDVNLVRELNPQIGWLFPQWLDPLLGGASVPAWCGAHPHLHGLAVSVAGFLVGGGVTWIVRIVGYAVLRREAMGFGDVVLMAMVGSFLGWQPTLAAFFVAPALACLFVVTSYLFHRQQEIPYGPYLSLGTLAILFGWQSFWPPFERIFNAGVLVLPMGLVMVAGMTLLLLAIQGIKRLFGITYDPDELEAVWTGADQSQYLAGERTDDQQGQWRRRRWPGVLSGRGQLHQTRWRHPHER